MTPPMVGGDRRVTREPGVDESRDSPTEGWGSYAVSPGLPDLI